MILELVLAMTLANTAPKEESGCPPKAEIEDVLKERYGEGLIFSGMTEAGEVRLYLNKTTGSWTLAGVPNVQPSGMCPLMGGAGGK